ncbi:DNA topoisomerase IB [Rhodopirellula halodulae]|uniref:DNA topoisomerase IB n=1 Tax=Rhodopirellula halodulae TaxID=2894198 RepID=UPI001E59FCBE|nr:hypothetical protein [Rhodopirellula sp. JC737]MCC9654283.1 hypothetical protein [Rhodopirellula sp. JC737]
MSTTVLQPAGTLQPAKRPGRRRAAKAGLVYVNAADQGYTRRRCGRGFTYLDASGQTVTNEKTRERIESLVIPPAWNDVFISRDPRGHIQASGVDDAGRRQYIYHERWLMVSAMTKFDRMSLFGERLPRLRRRLRRDLNEPLLSRDRVLAAVVRLLDKGQLRVGNRAYAKTNGAHGATTLLADHVEIDRTRIVLDFPGKSHQTRHVEFSDAKVAHVIEQCEEIEGQFLFQYLDDLDVAHGITSGDVNEYLYEATGETVTAKDFRTWWGSVIALEEGERLLGEDAKRSLKKTVSEVICRVAKSLGNTKAVCRSSYIHPGLIAALETGELPVLSKKLPAESVRELTIAETRMHALLPQLDFN